MTPRTSVTAAAAGDGERRLQAGGALIPGKHLYIERPEDQQLYDLLRQGEYCNILTSRQMGKSSLMARTTKRLIAEGYPVATPDISLFGEQIGADDWYQGLLQQVVKNLGLSVDVKEWWRNAPEATPNLRLARFFREEVAAKLPGDKPIILFVDEIDSTLDLPFADDFFLAMRAIYNERALTPEYRRIVFCPIGVASTNELIKNKKKTPYNIGKKIELRDFDPLRDDLSELARRAGGEEALQLILSFTGGQPYLTLKAVERFLEEGECPVGDADEFIDFVFGSRDEAMRDEHFTYIQDFIAQRTEDPLTTLQLYRQILGGNPVKDQVTPAHLALKLVGMVKRGPGGTLVVRNEVYRRLFTDAWAKSAMPPVERRVRSARQVAVAAMVLLLLSVGSYFELIYPRDRINTLNQVMDDYQLAQRNYRELKRVPFYSGKADELMAAFYERRALRDEQAGKRDQALLWRANAQALRPNDQRARKLGALVNPDYPNLLLTFSSSGSDRRRGPTGFEIDQSIFFCICFRS